MSDDIGSFGKVRAARRAGDVEYLRRALLDPENRFVAAKYLAELNATEAIPDLIRMLDASKQTHRAEAATALGRLGATDAVPRLIEVAESDESGPTRSYAVAALGRIGDPRAVPHLVRMVEDPEFWIRVSVVDALGTLGGAEAVHAIECAIGRERRWYWRQRYRRALKRAKRAT